MSEGTVLRRERAARRLMPAVLVAVVLLFFAADGPLGLLADLGHLCHSDETDCPDKDGDGAPCGPDCPCSCCPGHQVMPALLQLSFFLDAPGPAAAADPTEKSPAQKDISSLIFRPPRI